MTCATASAGYVAMALFSNQLADMSGSKPPLTFNNTGFAIQMVQDIVYSIGIATAFSQPTVYFGTVGANGELTLPGIANFSSLFRVPIYCAVGTAQSVTQLGQITDPVLLR